MNELLVPFTEVNSIYIIPMYIMKLTIAFCSHNLTIRAVYLF